MTIRCYIFYLFTCTGMHCVSFLLSMLSEYATFSFTLYIVFSYTNGKNVRLRRNYNSIPHLPLGPRLVLHFLYNYTCFSLEIITEKSGSR